MTTDNLEKNYDPGGVRLLDFGDLLFGSCRRVSHIKRYSSIPVVRAENVAEHSYYVCLIAMAIATDYMRRTKDDSKINMGHLLQCAIVHDIDEALTGDVLRSVKHGDPAIKSAFDSFAKRVVIGLEQSIGMPFLALWENQKSDTLEGYILSLSDLLSVVSYVVEELRSGNSGVYRILHEVAGWITKLQERYTNKIPNNAFFYCNFAQEMILSQLKKWEHLESKLQLEPGEDYHFVEFYSGEYKDMLEYYGKKFNERSVTLGSQSS